MERIEAICALIKKERISDQKELVDRLKIVYDIQTNQVAVSRDLRKLGIIKKVVKGKSIYELPQVDIRSELLNLAFVSLEYNETMIVIKTYPGLADFVGDCLDQEEDLGILGCLAGENVVFVIPKSIKEIALVSEKICARFYFKKEKP